MKNKLTNLAINKKIWKLLDISKKNRVDYAGDSNNALFLFEQLPYQKIIIQDRYGGGYSNGKYLCGFSIHDNILEELDTGPLASDIDASYYWGKKNKNVVADDFIPRAICLSWIKWRKLITKKRQKNEKNYKK